ncbi:MAG: HD domain-containing protein [Streptosporangiales bacterium]
MDVDVAQAIAEDRLHALGQRLRHVRAVATLAADVSACLGCQEREVLVAAAWLHDIGYAPSLVETGLHQLDGARWLAAQGEARLASLVAHHTCAHYEASLRGLGDELAKFHDEQSLVSDLLAWCDVHRGPSGETVTVAERLDEVEQRYPGGHIAPRALRTAEPTLVETCARVDALLARSADR